MAVTPEEILGGTSPVQQTWADRKPVQQLDMSAVERTGVENVRMPEAPARPQNAAAIVERGLATPAAAQSAPSPQAPPEKKKLTYTEMFQQMSPYKPPTPEEVEKERKKQKREAIFSAIGDGISALSNLYFTSQYAPNAYDPTRGMAATTKARFDKLKKEREDNQRQYMASFMQAMKMDADDERADRNWEHTLEREAVADSHAEAAEARAQAKADRDAAMAQLRMDLMQGRLDQQEAVAEAKRIEADYAEAYWQSRIGKNNYRRPIGSGGRPGEYPWYDSDGNLHYAHSYEAMRQNSINNGTWDEATKESFTETEETSPTGRSRGKKSSKKTEQAKGHSKKPENTNNNGSTTMPGVSEENRSSNTMPGVTQ